MHEYLIIFILLINNTHDIFTRIHYKVNFTVNSIYINDRLLYYADMYGG